MANAGSGKKQIVIIDKHPLVRRGIAELIGTDEFVEVCAEAGSFRDGLEAIKIVKADLVITGLSVSEDSGDGLLLIKEIHSKYADLPVLVLSMRDQSNWAARARSAGASGYVDKEDIAESLLVTVHSLLDEN